MTQYKLIVGDSSTPQVRVPKMLEETYLAPVKLDDTSVDAAFEIEVTVDQALAGSGYTAFLVNAVELSTGAGSNLLADWQVDGVSKASIDSSGNLTANNMVLETIGTFTPAMTIGLVDTGITYGTQAGFYHKMGDTVHFNLRISLTSKGGLTGVVRVTGLPFTSSSFINNSASCVVGMATGLSMVEGQTLTAFIDEGDAHIALKQWVAASNGTPDMQGTVLTDTTTLYISGSYFV